MKMTDERIQALMCNKSRQFSSLPKCTQDMKESKGLRQIINIYQNSSCGLTRLYSNIFVFLLLF